MTATLRDPMTMLRQRDADRDEAGSVAGSSTTAGGQPPARIGRTAAGASELGTARRGGPSFAAALVDIAPVLPTIAAIATVFAYIGVGGPNGLGGLATLIHLCPLLTGGVAALTVGLVLAGSFRPFFTAPDQAHPQSFAELRQRLDSLASQIRTYGGRQAGEQPPSQQLAVSEAAAHQRALERELSRGGPHWTIGTGYVDALTRLHRAEEALILVQPAEDVVAGALFDELRLAGSTIPERDRLLGKLRAAVQALSPSAAAYLTEATGSQRNKPVELQAIQQLHADAAPAAAGNSLQATQARMVLQGVRRAINDFRDESRARLIRSRCRLIGTMTVTGVITYVLLAFAVTVSPDRAALSSNPIAAAAAIYLVGGVMIVGMLSGMVEISAFTPAPSVVTLPTPAPGAVLDAATTAAAHGGKVKDAVLSLADIFNLEQYPFGLVLASIFGLMPKSFLERLQRASEQSKLNLQSTAATRQ